MRIHAGAIDKYKKIYSLFLNEEEWKIIHVSIFGNHPRFGEISSLEELNEKFTSLEVKGAKNFVLRRIAQKNYHSKELIKALKIRLVSQETIFLVLDEFIYQGYLNDEAWLGSFVRALRFQRFGFKAILLKLRQRGISKEEASPIIQEIKENESEEHDERASIKKLLETRYKQRDLSLRKERDKIIAALIRKGYQLDDVFSVLKELNSPYLAS